MLKGFYIIPCKLINIFILKVFLKLLIFWNKSWHSFHWVLHIFPCKERFREFSFSKMSHKYAPAIICSSQTWNNGHQCIYQHINAFQFKLFSDINALTSSETSFLLWYFSKEEVLSNDHSSYYRLIDRWGPPPYAIRICRLTSSR